MTDPAGHYDVAIVGGGLAGLTLALQISRSDPQMSVAVLERGTYPAPAAAHKVGEATVEIGARYLAHTLGLEDLLEETQLRKFGLRLFFGSGCHRDLSQADELGASRPLPAISYQLDRGVLENALAARVTERRVDIRSGCTAGAIVPGRHGDPHALRIREGDRERVLTCRWLVDASSRSALLKRSLGLARPIDHRMCAAWFRLDAAISVDDWSACVKWQARCGGLSRRPSTNHLMGKGYWAWIIPLAGGRTSIGLVTDPDVHPLATFNDFDRLRRWLEKHQPLLAGAIDGAAGTLMDFRHLRNLSQDSAQVWSPDRWAMTGEAGLFADPFYSPGTDFIGISNTFICNLITTSRAPADFAVHAALFQKMYQSFFGSTMSLYENLYPGFGDTRLMVVKSTWDYAYYWSILAWLFFRERLTDMDFLRSAQGELMRIRSLNAGMQAAFRKRALDGRADRGSGRFFDQIDIPVLAAGNAALLQPGGDPKTEFAKNCTRLSVLAPLLLALLGGGKAGGNHCPLLGDLEARLD